MGRTWARRSSVLATVAALAAVLVVVAAARDAKAAPDTFVRMSDGVEIALSVHLPADYVEGRRYPTLFEMSGYDGASAAGHTLAGDFGIPPEVPAIPRADSRQITDKFSEYVVVHASVRGTGCSGGKFDLFSWQSAEDGREIVDGWIPRQPWSNGDVAIIGHSYGGITGFMVAATQPQHLRAASLSGLVDDLYRGLVYPGGVSNYGFPLLWTGAVRPAYDLGGGLAPGLVRPQDDDDVEDRQARCAKAAATKSRTVVDDPLVQGLNPTDTEWYRARSPLTYADRIQVPLHITGAYQDEQTGPRGPAHLFEKSVNAPFRRLVLLNGDHGSQNPGSTGPEVWGDRKAWIDHFLLGRGRQPRRTSVTTLWEWHRGQDGQLRSNGRTDSRTYPLETTRWTDLFLQPGGGLAFAPPTADGAAPYLAGSPRQSWSYQAGPGFGPPFTTADGPDQAVFRTDPLPRAMAVAGPITATLAISTLAIDTDLFLQLADEAPDGSRTYLQRGMLKASHRALDPERSDRTPEGRIYRPWHPHTNPTPVTPGDVVEDYVVEVFPLGHVFRPGHRLVLLVHSPPAVDSYYAYAPHRPPPSVNTVHVGPAHPSRLQLPLVPVPQLGPELPCGGQEALRCIRAS